jgi:hypothetical protein
VPTGVATGGAALQETRVRDGLHLREKPLRIDRSLGPAIAPAQRKGRLAEFRASLKLLSNDASLRKNPFYAQQPPAES